MSFELQGAANREHNGAIVAVLYGVRDRYRTERQIVRDNAIWAQMADLRPWLRWETRWIIRRWISSYQRIIDEL